MIDNITLWHKRARPEPTERDLDVQIGCHIEEFIEMMDSLNIDANSDLARALDDLEEFADALKAGVHHFRRYLHSPRCRGHWRQNAPLDRSRQDRGPCLWQRLPYLECPREPHRQVPWRPPNGHKWHRHFQRR